MLKTGTVLHSGAVVCIYYPNGEKSPPIKILENISSHWCYFEGRPIRSIECFRLGQNIVPVSHIEVVNDHRSD